MEGTYKERLKTGGEVQVTASGWNIEYYFPGPDFRYNGTFVKIPGFRIDDYINAWLENFEEYVKLAETIPEEGSFEKNGLMNMRICIRGLHSGVCLSGYHLPVSSRPKLEAIIEDYKYAKSCAEKMMKILQEQ